MATSTLVQFLQSGEGAKTSNRSQEETFLAAGTIAAGDWVQFNTSATDANRVLSVIEATGATATGNPLVVGVALEPATTGQQVRVCIGGYCEGANVDNGCRHRERHRGGRHRPRVRRQPGGRRRWQVRRVGSEAVLIHSRDVGLADVAAPVRAPTTSRQ